MDNFSTELAELKELVVNLAKTVEVNNTMQQTNVDPTPPQPEMVELKELVVNLAKTVEENNTMQQTNVDSTPPQPALPTTPASNPWHNPEQVKKLLTVQKSAADSNVDEGKVVEILAKHNIPFHKTFSSNGNTKILLPNTTSATKAKEALTSEIPSNTVTQAKTRLPTINVVGYTSEIDKDTIMHDFSALNDSIASAIELDKTTGETSIEVMAIKPLLKDNRFYRANVRVSNNVRRAIACQGDRVFTSMGSKKVYDSFHVRRCYKCQGFGQIAQDCPSNLQTCGTCAGSPKTDGCTASPCCSNCKKKGNDTDHTAFSQSCPAYIEEQKKLQKTIQYHQKN